MKPELDVPKSTEWQKTNQSQVCPEKKKKKLYFVAGHMHDSKPDVDSNQATTEISAELGKLISWILCTLITKILKKYQT